MLPALLPSPARNTDGVPNRTDTQTLVQKRPPFLRIKDHRLKVLRRVVVERKVYSPFHCFLLLLFFFCVVFNCSLALQCRTSFLFPFCSFEYTPLHVKKCSIGSILFIALLLCGSTLARIFFFFFLLLLLLSVQGCSRPNHPLGGWFCGDRVVRCQKWKNPDGRTLL